MIVGCVGVSAGAFRGIPSGRNTSVLPPSLGLARMVPIHPVVVLTGFTTSPMYSYSLTPACISKIAGGSRDSPFTRTKQISPSRLEAYKVNSRKTHESGWSLAGK